MHDLRQIVYSARLYLCEHPHVFLSTTVTAFADGLERVLADPAWFGGGEFVHIAGRPGELLANGGGGGVGGRGGGQQLK